MTTITASQVQALRERTGAGMMECKKALTAANGDIDAAIEALRIKGTIKADNIAGRVAAEGIVVVKNSSDNKASVIIEMNTQTDFAGRNENVIAFAERIAEQALAHQIEDVAALQALTLDDDMTVEEARRALIAKVGENIQIRRMAFIRSEDNVASYVHGGRIGVIVELSGGDAQLGKDLAMHIAANNPQVINREEVSAELVEKEKEIFSAQAQTSGKPAEIIEKMIGGRIAKFLDEVSLVGQPFVKNPDLSVEKLLQQHKAKVLNFIRFAVGEGIEKQADDFVAEVMAQAQAQAQKS